MSCETETALAHTHVHVTSGHALLFRCKPSYPFWGKNLKKWLCSTITNISKRRLHQRCFSPRYIIENFLTTLGGACTQIFYSFLCLFFTSRLNCMIIVTMATSYIRFNIIVTIIILLQYITPNDAQSITKIEFQVFNNTQCQGTPVRTQSVLSTTCSAYNFTAGTYITAYCEDGIPNSQGCDDAACEKCLELNTLPGECVLLDGTQSELQVVLSSVMSMSSAAQVADLVAHNYSVKVTCPDALQSTGTGNNDPQSSAATALTSSNHNILMVYLFTIFITVLTAYYTLSK